MKNPSPSRHATKTRSTTNMNNIAPVNFPMATGAVVTAAAAASADTAFRIHTPATLKTKKGNGFTISLFQIAGL